MAFYPQSPSSTGGTPRPAYFIVRTSGKCVPLIGVDELPVGTDLVGVPRALSLGDTMGMLNLGIHRSSDKVYQIAPQEEEKPIIANAPATPKSPKPVTKSKAAAAQQPTSPCSATITTVASTPFHPDKRLSVSPFAENRVCRYWFILGTCRWGQKCYYRHIMPKTITSLKEIGMNDWPSWYRDLNPGYFVSEATHSTPYFSKRGKARDGRERTVCTGESGYCDVMKLGKTQSRADRSRAAKLWRKDLGKLTVANLRALPKVKKAVEKDPVSVTAMLERAVAKNTKDWEEDSDITEAGKEEFVEKVKIKQTSSID